MSLAEARPEAAPASAPAAAPLPLGTVVAYGVAAIGLTVMGFVNALYLFKYCTDVLLLAPGIMGLLYGASRVWDAISDPLVGRWSDRTASRFGRRRSWIFASIPPTAIAFVMLWAPPTGLGELGLAIWVGAALLGFSTAQTMFSVPHYALGVEMTSDHHDRTRVFGLRQLMNGPGLLLGLGAFYLLTRAEQPREVAPVLAVSIAVFGALLVGGAVARLRERPEYQGRGGEDIRRAFGDVLRNPHARLLLLMYGIESFGAATTGILAIYVTEYIVKLPGSYTLMILLFYIIPSFGLAPLWIRLSRRIGKRRLWIFSMSVAAASYLAHSFLAEGRIVFWCAISFLSGSMAGVGNVIGPSIKGDVIDWDELQSGERKEGAYLAVWTFVQKSAGGLCAILLGFALQLVGFEPNVEQSEATKLMILVLYGALPGACFAVGTWLLVRFRLDEAAHAEVLAGLEERRARTED